MTEEQAKAWFTYHAPNETTLPKYGAIRLAESEAAEALAKVLREGPLDRSGHQTINEATKRFALKIAEVCPPCNDTDAAIEWVRLARHAANEELVGLIQTGGSGFDLRAEDNVLDYLRNARWKANSAVACGGV